MEISDDLMDNPSLDPKLSDPKPGMKELIESYGAPDAPMDPPEMDEEPEYTGQESDEDLP